MREAIYEYSEEEKQLIFDHVAYCKRIYEGVHCPIPDTIKRSSNCLTLGDYCNPFFPGIFSCPCHLYDKEVVIDRFYEVIL